jgi:hypothetical protein
VVLGFGITVFSSLRIFQNSLNGIPVDPVIQQFDTAAEGALISFLLTVMIVQALTIPTWVKIFKALAVVNAVAICVDFLFFSGKVIFQHLPLSEIIHHEPWGLLLNASMSGCFNASIFPFLDRKEKTLRYLVLISIVLAGRSLPIAVLFAGIGASLLIQKRYKELAIAIPGSFALGFLIKGTNLFQPRGRDWIWTQTYYFFRDHIHWAIGSGLGGFYIVGPTLTGKNGVIFTWLHSDWLQVLFEEGLIGFAIIASMYIHALWRTRKNAQLFSALVAYAAFGVANMPLRYPLAGILGAFLIRWSMEERDEKRLL